MEHKHPASSSPVGELVGFRLLRVFQNSARGQSVAKHSPHCEFDWYEAFFGSSPETRPLSVASQQLADSLGVGIGSVDEGVSFYLFTCGNNPTGRMRKGRGGERAAALDGS